MSDPASETTHIRGVVEKVGGLGKRRWIDQDVVEVRRAKTHEKLANAEERNLVGVVEPRDGGEGEVDILVRLVERVELLLPLVLLKVVRVVRVVLVVVVHEHHLATNVLDPTGVEVQGMLQARADRRLFCVDVHREQHKIRLAVTFR